MEQYFDIGRIINTHGVRGEVKVMPFTDNSERYVELTQVFIDKPSGLEKYDIRGVKFFKNQVILKFAQVEDMNTAESLKGLILKIDRRDAVELPKDTYFICDLIGSGIVDENGNSLGTLKDIIQTGANDVYVVEDEKNREILIPALKSVVKEISLENKTIRVILPKGLLDDEI